jgi:hypothetical protein
LGDMFESTRAQNHHLRTASHRWVMWAGKWVYAMCSAWSKAFALTLQAQTLSMGPNQTSQTALSAGSPVSTGTTSNPALVASLSVNSSTSSTATNHGSSNSHHSTSTTPPSS